MEDIGAHRRTASRHDVITVLGSTGAVRKLLRLQVNGAPYLLRSQVQRTLTTATEKRFRSAAAKALAEAASDEEEVSFDKRARERSNQLFFSSAALPGVRKGWLDAAAQRYTDGKWTMDGPCVLLSYAAAQGRTQWPHVSSDCAAGRGRRHGGERRGASRCAH
jgi:hypothetical protein